MWDYKDGKFVQLQHQSFRTVNVKQVETQLNSITTDRLTSTEPLQTGLFVESTGQHSPAYTGFDHNGFSVADSAVHVRLCGSDGHSLGVVSKTATPHSTTAKQDIKTCGTVLAWLIQPLKQIIPLSGVYTRTINGVASGHVIVQTGSNGELIFSETKTEVKLLKERLDALTLPPI